MARSFGTREVKPLSERLGTYMSKNPLITLLVVVAVVLFVLEIGTKVFDWKWTGFLDATLWDWLNLLILPIALALAPLWFETRHKWQRQWKTAFIVAVVVLVILAIGGYTLGWGWTGFKGNKLWDWLKLLVVPFVLPAVLLWFTMKQDAIMKRIERQEQEAVLKAEVEQFVEEDVAQFEETVILQKPPSRRDVGGTFS